MESRDHGATAPPTDGAADRRRARQLAALGELRRLRIAAGDPDVRGWSVVTAHGERIGRVQELLVDPEALEVVMLDVELAPTRLRAGDEERHTLAPIRAAELDRTLERVILDVSDVRTVDDMPALARRGAISDADVDEFDRRYRRAWGTRGRGVHGYRYRRTDEEELHFGRLGDQADAPPDPPDDDAAAPEVEAGDTALAAERDRLAREAARLAAERERLAAERAGLERDDATPDDRCVERRACRDADWPHVGREHVGTVRLPVVEGREAQ